MTGTSREGFDAEWREIGLFAFEGDLLCRFEIFDEADLDAALMRFDELDRPAPLLENAATRARARLADAFNRRDLNGYLALMSADGWYEDQRKVLRDDARRGPRLHAQCSRHPSHGGWRQSRSPSGDLASD